jgi:ABC-type lipoprotein release transport system permease subunit
MLSRFVGSLLYEVRPTDPGTYLAAAGALAAVILAACYIPARRATRLDPASVLRAE